MISFTDFCSVVNLSGCECCQMSVANISIIILESGQTVCIIQNQLALSLTDRVEKLTSGMLDKDSFRQS